MYMLVIGVICLIGAATGNMVLEGTEISEALAVFSIDFICIGIYQLANSGKNEQTKTRLPIRSAAKRGTKTI